MHYFKSILFRNTGKNGAVSCSSKKARYEKRGRSRVNTGVNFFTYSAFFDMMYDTHITELSVFLLVNLYLLIRYRNRLTYFLT